MNGADVDDLARRIGGLERPLLVALDVDGTLAPIVDDPEAARVPPEVRAALRGLEGIPGVQVALVTGRDARSLERVAGALPVWRAVSHGRTVLGPEDPAREAGLSGEVRAKLERFRGWAEREAVPEGARLEDKDGAVAVHVRELAQRDGARAGALLERVRERAEGEGLQVRLGRAVCEAEAEAGDKGTALAKLADATGAAGVVYAGDDLTDLPAIRWAAERGGIGLFVRSAEREPPPEATTALDGPAQVADLLRILTQTL